MPVGVAAEEATPELTMPDVTEVTAVLVATADTSGMVLVLERVAELDSAVPVPSPSVSIKLPELVTETVDPDATDPDTIDPANPEVSEADLKVDVGFVAKLESTPPPETEAVLEAGTPEIADPDDVLPEISEMVETRSLEPVLAMEPDVASVDSDSLVEKSELLAPDTTGTILRPVEVVGVITAKNELVVSCPAELVLTVAIETGVDDMVEMPEGMPALVVKM